jgi:hypothetical protein
MCRPGSCAALTDGAYAYAYAGQAEPSQTEQAEPSQTGPSQEEAAGHLGEGESPGCGDASLVAVAEELGCVGGPVGEGHVGAGSFQ